MSNEDSNNDEMQSAQDESQIDATESDDTTVAAESDDTAVAQNIENTAQMQQGKNSRIGNYKKVYFCNVFETYLLIVIQSNLLCSLNTLRPTPPCP